MLCMPRRGGVASWSGPMMLSGRVEVVGLSADVEKLEARMKLVLIRISLKRERPHNVHLPTCKLFLNIWNWVLASG